MMTNRALWTLEELVARVAMALSVDYGGAASGRVRDVPDARVVRYYTTLGLIDRPAGWQGRTALYGERHLAQLVAIKKLQSRGWSLAKVQEHLAGIDDATLARIADVGTAATGEIVAGSKEKQESFEETAEAKPSSRRAQAFWAARPAEPAAPMPALATPAPPGNLPPRQQSERAEIPTAPGSVSPAPMQGLKLGDHATLLVEAARALDHADLEAISAAAAPLLKVLEARGLLHKEEKGEKQ